MADITLISIPMAKNCRSSSSGSWVRSWTSSASTSKVRRQLRGDVGVARGGGEPVQLDLEQLGVLHELDVGLAHGRQGLLALEARAGPGQSRR